MKTKTAEIGGSECRKTSGSAPGLALTAADSDVFEQMTVILDKIADGATLNAALSACAHGVSWFYSQLVKFDSLQVTYARAKEVRADVFADAIIDIVDEEGKDPAVVRNRVDARKWHVSKMNPNKYGERISLDINKKVDIAGALLEGRKRVAMREARVVDAQPVDYTEITTD